MLLAEESDDMAQAVADTMEAISGDFNDKAISLIKVASGMDSDIDAIKAEIERLKGRQKSIESRQKSMKEYLRINMEGSGISKIICPLFTITLAKGRDIVKIISEDEIPDNYINVKTVKSPMKKEILDALKNGDDVKGAILGKSANSVRVK